MKLVAKNVLTGIEEESKVAGMSNTMKEVKPFHPFLDTVYEPITAEWKNGHFIMRRTGGLDNKPFMVLGVRRVAEVRGGVRVKKPRKPELLIESISNGLGGQSMFLMTLAADGKIPARVSITADTGAELDCVWNNGRRSSAEEYFVEVVAPFAKENGIDARFVRSVDKFKKPLPPLLEHLKEVIAQGKLKSAKMPLFGSEGGRLLQVCTDKWKIRAIRQEARRMGATRLVTAQGIHFAEAGRRVKGIKLPYKWGDNDEWTIYQDTKFVKVDDEKVEVAEKWCRHYYPMVDLEYGRTTAQVELKRRGIPYLVTSQCDACPHNDLDRWLRHAPEVLVEIAEVETSMGGKFFFTDERVPLMQALEIKKAKPRSTLEPSFGCEGGICGV